MSTTLSEFTQGGPFEAVPLTKGPFHHFFGYYDKHQWDASDRRLLTLQVPFADRSPGPEDVAKIGVIDTHRENRLEIVGETRSWCWQQACMLQWLPQADDDIIYNDRIGDRFVSVIQALNVGVGLGQKTDRRILPRPIYTVSPDGRTALSLNFSRLARTRPGYGYAGLPDFRERDPHPADDGVFIMDLQTGDHDLVVSIDALARLDPVPSMEGATHWVNHLLFNPTSKRFIFLHRWNSGKGFETRMYTCGVNGDGLHRVPIDRASHFVWYDDDHILVWARSADHGDAYHLCTDRSDKTEAIGKDVFTRDGHCTRSPDGAWMLTDEYTGQDGKRPLMLYHLESGRRIDLLRLASLPAPVTELRCDLHPRWNRSGTQICIDSTHEGTRQMYLVDVSSLTRSA